MNLLCRIDHWTKCLEPSLKIWNSIVPHRYFGDVGIHRRILHWLELYWSHQEEQVWLECQNETPDEGYMLANWKKKHPMLLFSSLIYNLPPYVCGVGWAGFSIKREGYLWWGSKCKQESKNMSVRARRISL